ncbi:MAG: radical SAM protein [Magnetococcales bacterium]|nr:radical SAM protein [Magnetococcales bacterium]
MMNRLSKMYHWLYIRLKYGFHLKNPTYPFLIIKNLLRAKWNRLTGKQNFVLRGIDFAVTYNCNFNCEHCYSMKLKDNQQKRLTPEEYASICKQSMELGCVCFSLQGGEVFVRKDWEEIINAFMPKRNHLLITTNASLLDEARIVRLKELGVDTLYFSLDSGLPAEHDAFRRADGNFAKIMECIGFCNKHSVKVVINTCVTKQNLHSAGLKALLDYSHANHILVETIFARGLGNLDGHMEYMLDEQDVRDYYELRKNYPYVVRNLDNNYQEWGCPGMKEVLYITAYGEVCPCPYTHISMGNVRLEPLRTIRERGLQRQWWNHYHQECLTAQDQTFKEQYYKLIDGRPIITIEEFEKGELDPNNRLSTLC